jgi:Thioredoxin
VWGFVGFLAIGLAAFFRSRLLLPLSALAALASLLLFGVSAFSIRSLCVWCEAVHIASFVSFGLALAARRAELAPLSAAEPTVLSLAPSFGFLLAAVLFVPPYWGAFGWKGDLPFAYGQTPEGTHWIGAAAPKLTIEEFVDYSCPHCRVASALNLRRLAQHPDELRIVRRYYPRISCGPSGDNRCLAFRIAHCAGEQGKFWQTDRWLFEHFDTRAEYDLNEASRDIGLDRARLGECVEADATYEWAINVWKSAKKLRVPGTPYYLVGDRLLAQDRIPALLDAL